MTCSSPTPPKRFIRAEELVAFLPAVELDPAGAQLVRNGVKVEPPAGSDLPADEPLRIMCGGRLVAVARVAEGLMRTEVVLP